MNRSVRRGAVALVSGALFSAGLVLSGMTEPKNIIGFLDVTGDFRPNLLWVMVGAILVHATVVSLTKKRERPLLDERFQGPTKKTLDARLLGGAALFGVGWGLGGFCPGPSLVALGAHALPVLVFVAAMLGSMWVMPRQRSGR